MNELLEVWRTLTPGEKHAMAKRLDTVYVYLSQIAHGHRNPGKHFKKALLADLENLKGD